MPGMIGVAHGEWRIPAPAGAVASVFVATNSGAFAYTAATNSWVDVTPTHADDLLPAIAAVAGHLWVASHTPTLWHSTDDGATWATVALPGSGGTCDTLFVSGSLLLAARNDCDSSADNGLWTRPVDGSGSWTQIVSASTNFLGMGDIVGDRLWYAINSGPIRHFHFRTPATSGGADTDLATTGAAGTFSCIRGEPSDETIAYFGSSFDHAPGPAHLYRADDTTVTEISPATGNDSGPVDVASNGIGVLLTRWREDTGDDTIYRSTDGGATWASVKSGSTLINGWPLTIWTSTAGVVVGWGVVLALSADAGLTWTDSAACDSNINALAAL